MAEQPSAAAMGAWRRFLEVHVVITRQLDEELQHAHGLPLSWYDVLVQLNEVGGRRRMSELAQAVLLTRSNCTRLVDRMERDGLVVREADAADARSKWAVLTPAGKRRLVAAAPVHLEGIERLFGQFLDDRSASMMAERFDLMIPES